MLNLIPKKYRMFAIRFLRVALPFSLELLVQNSFVFIDSLMIGQLGETATAGVYIAGRIQFFLFLIIFGISSGSTVSLGQYWGNKNYTLFHKTIGFVFLCMVAVSVLFTYVAAHFSHGLLGIFSHDSLVLNEATVYLRIMIYGYIPQAIAFIFFAVLRVVGKAIIPMYISVVMLLLNTLLDWVFIFGIGFFPSMGVQGAALATVISIVLQFFLSLFFLLCVLRFPKRIKSFFSWSYGFVRQYARVTAPVVFSEIGWALAILMYDFVFGILGKEAQASVSIAGSFFRMMMVFFFGSAQATTVVFSQMIGAGKIRKAQEYARVVLVFITALSMGFMLFILAFAGIIPKFFNFEPQTKRMLTGMIFAFGIPFPFTVINTHIIVGFLRAGADTVFSMLLEIGCVWLIGVSSVMCAGLVFDLSPPIVVLSAGLEEVVKGVIGITRIRSRRWIRQISQ